MKVCVHLSVTEEYKNYLGRDHGHAYILKKVEKGDVFINEVDKIECAFGNFVDDGPDDRGIRWVKTTPSYFLLPDYVVCSGSIKGLDGWELITDDYAKYLTQPHPDFEKRLVKKGDTYLDLHNMKMINIEGRDFSDNGPDDRGIRWVKTTPSYFLLPDYDVCRDIKGCDNWQLITDEYAKYLLQDHPDFEKRLVKKGDTYLDLHNMEMINVSYMDLSDNGPDDRGIRWVKVKKYYLGDYYKQEISADYAEYLSKDYGPGYVLRPPKRGDKCISRIDGSIIVARVNVHNGEPLWVLKGEK